MKIAVVGAGNGGSFTALFYAWYGRNRPRSRINIQS